MGICYVDLKVEFVVFIIIRSILLKSGIFLYVFYVVVISGNLLFGDIGGFFRGEKCGECCGFFS